MSKLRTGLALLSLCLFAAPTLAAPTLADAAQPLLPFQASYLWRWKGLTVAVSYVQLQHDANDQWTYRSHSDPRGIGYLYPYRPKMESVLRVTDAGVQPLHYLAQGGGSSSDRNADVTFDWNAEHAGGTYEGTRVDLTLQPGVQDDLSVQIALMVALLRGQTPQHLSLLDKNSVRDYLYTREGEETLDTPLGRIDTVIYASRHPGSPRTTRFWCAPSKGYLPLRVQQKRLDEVEWTMEIRSLER